MNYIIRRDPFREVMSLRSAMERLMDDAFIGSQNDWQSLPGELALDVVETGEAFQVAASVPGIKVEDLELTFSGRTLTIKGEYKAEEEKKEARYHLRERRYGSFARSITLPTPIKADGIEAKVENGVLLLTLPKSEDVMPKRITVQSAESPRVVEAKSADIRGKN